MSNLSIFASRHVISGAMATIYFLQPYVGAIHNLHFWKHANPPYLGMYIFLNFAIWGQFVLFWVVKQHTLESRDTFKLWWIFV